MSVNVVKRPQKSGKVTWHVRWYRSQLDPVVMLGRFDTEAEAIIRRDVVREIVAAGEYPVREKLEFKGGGRFKELTEKWLASRIDVGDATKANDLTYARKAVARYGTLDPRRITRQDVQAWIGEMIAEGLTRGTIKNTVKKGLSQILDYGVREGWLDVNVTKEVDLPHQGKRKVEHLPTVAEWLLVREGLAAYAAKGKDPVLVFDLITHAGCRISEAIDLTWREVGVDRIVVGGKNDTPLRNVRVLPYQPNWMPVKPEGASLDDKVCGDRITAGSFRQQLNRTCEKVGVDPINPHKMRKLCASLMHTKLAVPIADGGHGLDVVSMALRMGHTQEVFLRTYSTLIPPACWR